MKVKDSQKQTIGNMLLILSLTASVVSGMYLHLTSKESDLWQSSDILLFPTITHVACSVLALIFVSIHAYHNRKWYKSLFSKHTSDKKRHSKDAIILSAVFLIVVFTGFADCANDYPNSILGMIHGKLGILMILCAIVHVYKRLIR